MCAQAEQSAQRKKTQKLNIMQATKLQIRTGAAIPLIAALPFALATNSAEMGTSFEYNPSTQLSEFRGGRDFSTCREDESVIPFFGRSKSDTKKDD